jgi:hypothetical protein
MSNALQATDAFGFPRTLQLRRSWSKREHFAASPCNQVETRFVVRQRRACPAFKQRRVVRWLASGVGNVAGTAIEAPCITAASPLRILACGTTGWSAGRWDLAAVSALTLEDIETRSLAITVYPGDANRPQHLC